MVTVFKNQIATQDLIDKKVDKEEGKGLSTNNFTNSYKNLLDNLPKNLDKKVDKVDGQGLSTNDFTDEHKTKLDNLPESDELENRFETKADKKSLAAVATTGSYNDLIDISSVSNRRDLLDTINLSKWSIKRQPTDKGAYIGHYAGAVDLSSEKLNAEGLSSENLDGISGALVQLATGSFYSAWTDFEYDDKVVLGNKFQFKITPFIKTNDYNSGKQIFEDSFVDVKLGIFSIRLFRWASDMYDGETYNNDNFYKLRVGICLNDQLAAFSPVVTTPKSEYVTTDICDGKPASTDLGEANSGLIEYMRECCLDQTGKEYGAHTTTTFTADDGFQDLTVVYNNKTIQILDVNNKPLEFNIFLPNKQGSIVEVSLVAAGCQDAVNGIIDFLKVIELSEEYDLSLPTPTFNNINIKVRCYHDRAAALYHPLALMRFIVEADTPTLPVEKGGTGAITAELARLNLGAAEAFNILSVEKGGTGATTAELARLNLGAAEAFDVLSIEKGGTGANTPEGARENLHAAETFEGIYTIQQEDWDNQLPPDVTINDEPTLRVAVDIPFLLSSDYPIVDVLVSGDMDANNLKLELWSHIVTMSVDYNGYLFIWTDYPEDYLVPTAISIMVKVVR